MQKGARSTFWGLKKSFVPNMVFQPRKVRITNFCGIFQGIGPKKCDRRYLECAVWCLLGVKTISNHTHKARILVPLRSSFKNSDKHRRPLNIQN